MYTRSALMGIVTVFFFVGLLAGAAAASKSTDHFVKNAAIGNQFEIESSRLALKNSRNDKVREFAQKMIDDHKRIGDDMKAALSSSGLAEPSPSLDADHQKIMDKLEKYTNKDFDKYYIGAQTDAHDDAIALFSDYSKTGDDQDLKNFAAQDLPIIQGHRDHIAKIRNDY